MHFLATLAILPIATQLAAAICPGFNYGIGNREDLGNGVSRWRVYATDCTGVDGLTTNQNACHQGIFGCSPPPIIFNEYTNTFTGLRYKCRTDSRAGSCGGDNISVCCRNDGN